MVFTPAPLKSLRPPTLVPQPALTKLCSVGPRYVVVPPAAAPAPAVPGTDLPPAKVLRGPEDEPRDLVSVVPGPEAERMGLRGIFMTLPESLALLHVAGSAAGEVSPVVVSSINKL